MKKLVVLLLTLLLLPTPVMGVSYSPVSFTSDGVEVIVSIQADTPWSAPFSESVNLSIGVTPLIDNTLGVNITSISLIVNSEEADGTGYTVIDADDESGTPLTMGVSYANYSTQLGLSGTGHGLVCYFAVVVTGSYRNGTHQEFFQALSPDNLVGPFVISASLESPIVWVGLIVLAIFGVIFIAGMYGVKKSRKRSSRRRLED